MKLLVAIIVIFIMGTIIGLFIALLISWFLKKRIARKEVLNNHDTKKENSGTAGLTGTAGTARTNPSSRSTEEHFTNASTGASTFRGHGTIKESGSALRTAGLDAARTAVPYGTPTSAPKPEPYLRETSGAGQSGGAVKLHKPTAFRPEPTRRERDGRDD